MVRLYWDIQGTLASLNDLEAGLDNRDRLWDRLEFNVLDIFVREVFATQGYGTWQPKADGTPATLIDTGRLFESYVNPTSPDHVEQESDDLFEFGSNLFYAVYHEEGTDNLPQREIVGLLERNPLFEEALESETQLWINEQEREARL